MAQRRAVSETVRRAGDIVGIVAGFVAIAGLIGAAGIKLNAKANADIGASKAQERIAAALERISPADRPAMVGSAHRAFYSGNPRVSPPPAPSLSCDDVCGTEASESRGSWPAGSRWATLPTLGGTAVEARP